MKNIVIIIVSLFMIYTMLYNGLDKDYHIRWDIGFFIMNYSIIIGALWYIAKDMVKIELAFFIVVISYFLMLCVMNVICFMKPELYVTLISKTKLVNMPFAVLMLGMGFIKIYSFIKKVKSHDN